MAVLSTFGLFALFGIVVAYVINRLTQSNNGRGRPLPPGPKGLPLLGNVNDLPKPGMLECHHWLKHKDLYGPISSITVLGQTFVIINDAQIAIEMLRDRAALHSARPHMVFSSDMIGWKNTLAFSGYTDTFKLHRKNIAKVAGSTTSLKVFDRVQEEEAVHFLLNLLSSPENLFDHIKKEAGAVILKITYGYNAEPHGKDLLVDMAGKTMHEFADATVAGKWPVDIMPFLRYAPEWLPGTGFKATARAMTAQLRQTTEQPYEFVKQQMREGKHKTSFLSQAIENSTPEMEQLHKWSASSMYLGGADTTVSALMTFFLVMTLYPDVQKKAQEELDRVIGSGRLPTSADKGTLPYIDAVVNETHRWHPVAPMALPHSSTEEDTIRGYRIPKGALLLPNNWWFTHDPAVYPDPEQFRPERFLDTPTHKAEPDPRTWTFGYGRRVCPGRYVADNALFITIAQVLAVFNIEKPVDANGKPVEPALEFEPGVVSHPVPYRAIIKPRSEVHEKLIKQSELQYPWEPSDAKALATVKW
ncbi:cytochrome P450 [Cucurbitaria berberidis CBS 394.84]|uniref:Cytochrome P450 n=1 Tax=Cucurbitaria berberidis CBS 394.84 TaxID=1168544 RepID=A0A9P4GCE6_9PLEO|nr:cytochrome P450 [Cucurbitaria berberidis CBS 394.84]KAF1842847.1 cytochrome P450 [Cucurbitaria berberidis CBS 394.84]